MQGDLCAYTLQEYKEKQGTARRCKQVAFTLPASTKSCQGASIVNIHPAYDDTIVTVQEDGTVCCWSPELKPLRTKHTFVCLNSFAFIPLKANLVPFCAFLIVKKDQHHICPTQYWCTGPGFLKCVTVAHGYRFYFA